MKRWAFFQAETVAMRSKDVKLFEKRLAVWDAVSIPVPSAWEKKREKTAV